MADPFEVEARGYKDAIGQAKGLSTMGEIIKVIGLLVIIASVIGAFMSAWPAVGIGIGIGGTAIGGLLMGMGSIIAAMGQVLMAIVQTAVSAKVSASVALGHVYEDD